MATYRHPWDLLEYGGDVVYWLTVEGLGTVWTERALGATLPTGFSAEDAILVVDRSSEVGSTVDPDSGLGTGLPLSFQLRDSTTLAGYLLDPSRVTRLSADLAAAATTMTVEDASSLPGSGSVYIGRERIDYTGTTATTLTGLTRGVAGVAFAHSKDSSAALVANVPATDWRGRTVRLYAAVIDATGFVPSGTLTDLSAEVWAGFVREGPYRTVDGTWQIDALSLDRKLDEPLDASIIGTIDASTIYHSVQAGDAITCTIKYGSMPTIENLTAVPYTLADTGPLGIVQVTGSALRAAVVTAWDAAVAALGGSALMGHLRFEQVGAGWRGAMDPGASTPATGDVFSITLSVAGATKTENVIWINASGPVPMPWEFNDNPLHPGPDVWAVSDPYLEGSITVALEGVLPADVPTAGGLKIKGSIYSYSGASPLGGALRLYGVHPAPSPSTLTDLDGEDAELIQMTTGSLADVLRRVIESSGTSGLRGPYDILPGEAGYGIAGGDVDEPSFSAVVGGSLGGIAFDLALSDRSLADALGGLLGLAERAVVLRDDGSGKQRLTLVRTSPSGASTVAIITDADVLVSEQATPVEVDRGAPVPTTIEVELANGLVESPSKLIFRRDRGKRQQSGSTVFSATIPLTDVSQAISYVGIWAAGRFARPRPHAIIALRVPPWVLGEPGDLAALSLRHASLYDYSTGVPGYTGPARIIGRTLDLGTYQSVITCIPAQGSGLSPAAEVSNWTGTAASPTTIDVGQEYAKHFERTLALAASTFDVLHYTPGADAATEGYTISGVTDTGTVCRLTVSALIGTPTLSIAGAGSWLTLPVTANCTDYQAAHAHTDSGGPWS